MNRVPPAVTVDRIRGRRRDRDRPARSPSFATETRLDSDDGLALLDLALRYRSSLEPRPVEQSTNDDPARPPISYGEIRADLERRGRPTGDADLRIASIALARDLTVVTGNVRHFQPVPGLRVEDWLIEPDDGGS